eukprot:3322354-Amphidinium_carterae.1
MGIIAADTLGAAATALEWSTAVLAKLELQSLEGVLQFVDWEPAPSVPASAITTIYVIGHMLWTFYTCLRSLCRSLCSIRRRVAPPRMCTGLRSFCRALCTKRGRAAPARSSNTAAAKPTARPPAATAPSVPVAPPPRPHRGPMEPFGRPRSALRHELPRQQPLGITTVIQGRGSRGINHNPCQLPAPLVYDPPAETSPHCLYLSALRVANLQTSVENALELRQSVHLILQHAHTHGIRISGKSVAEWQSQASAQKATSTQQGTPALARRWTLGLWPKFWGPQFGCITRT